MSEKLKSFSELVDILKNCQNQGQKVVQCHGVFDLLHPGHIRHLKEAKSLGDKLVVTVTPDKFVNKGPGRPAFNEQLRVETLCALNCVDYVVLNDMPDAVTAIEKVKPDVYVKGKEYKDHGLDVTGKISAEVAAVEKHNGKVHYSDDIVFSSSSLLNKYFSSSSEEVNKFMEEIKKFWSCDEILDKINALTSLKVLVIGDAIIDEYQYVEPLGQSGKGLHMAAACLDREVFLGGSLIIANHIAQFSDNVTLMTAVGKSCPHLSFIKNALDPKVKTKFIFVEDEVTLIKKRYVLQDGKTLSKLFETYSSNNFSLDESNTKKALDLMHENLSDYDLVLVADFGNGFTNADLIEEISKIPNFLALNTQTNSGNRGYNVVTQYKRADYISLNEPEIRLAAQNKRSSLNEVVNKISKSMNCKMISVTRGVKGVNCFEKGKSVIEVPAFVSDTVDRVGAGDSYFSVSALCAAKKYPMVLQGFLGSLASSLNVQIVGNKESIKKASFLKFLIRLMK